MSSHTPLNPPHESATDEMESPSLSVPETVPEAAPGAVPETAPETVPETVPVVGAPASHIERLRRLGVRVTPQRLLVLEALERTGGHTTAEAIMRWTSQQYPALNLATVYRALDLLVSVGLVAQTDLGGGATSYELVGDSPHHHLACERCGKVIEMDESLLGALCAEALGRYGFHARPRHLAIFGVCAACYDSARDEPAS